MGLRLVALAAGYLPALRASRLEPTVALRQEWPRGRRRRCPAGNKLLPALTWFARPGRSKLRSS